MSSQSITADPIFAILSGSPEDQQVMSSAAALAAKRMASVTAVYVGRDPSATLLMGGDGFTGGVGAMTLEALQAERRESRDRAQSVAEQYANTVFDGMDGSRTNVASLARLTAFVVMSGACARTGGVQSDVLGELLIDGGVAVLLARTPPPYERVGLAWDGSREAARALRSGRDVIAQADHVVVLQSANDLNRKDLPSADPERVAAWIERRGVSVSIQSFEGRSVADSLIDACVRERVDILIAGAYGQTRFREAVFGGVTRSLIEAEAPSLFLAH